MRFSDCWAAHPQQSTIEQAWRQGKHALAPAHSPKPACRSVNASLQANQWASAAGSWHDQPPYLAVCGSGRALPQHLTRQHHVFGLHICTTERQKQEIE